MRKALSFLLTVAFFLGFGGLALAQEKTDLHAAIDSVTKQSEQPSWGGKVSSTWASKYIGFLGPLASDQPVIQSELWVDQFTQKNQRPSGWHFGAWWSTGLQEKMHETTADQIDFTVGHTWKWDKNYLAADVIYKDFIPLSRKDGDVIVTRLKFGYDFDLGDYGKLKPYVTAECWTILPDYIRRPVATVGAEYVYKLFNQISVTGGFYGLFDYGTDTADRGFLVRPNMGVRWAVTDSVSASLSYQWSRPIGMRDRDCHDALYASIIFNF